MFVITEFWGFYPFGLSYHSMKTEIWGLVINLFIFFISFWSYWTEWDDIFAFVTLYGISLVSNDPLGSSPNAHLISGLVSGMQSNIPFLGACITVGDLIMDSAGEKHSGEGEN